MDHLTNREKQREAERRYKRSPKGRANCRKRASQRYYRLKEQGLCVLCSKPARPGKINCEPCGDRSVTNGKFRKETWAKSGICTNCGKNPSLPAMIEKRYPFCERCYFKKTSIDCLKTAKHAELIGQKLRDQNYRCAYTGEKIILGLNDSLDHILPVSKFPELRSNPANVEWVTRKVNCMKWDSTREEFIATAYAVVKHYESQFQLVA